MAPGLAFRILVHLEELGLLEPGKSVILDPMAGIGTSLLAAAIRGHRAVGVELEEKFCKLARENAERIGLKGFGAPIEVIQGDARRLSELLAEKGMVSVISPPYQTGTGVGQSLTPLPTKSHTVRGRGFTSRGPSYAEECGSTPGQIGNLPDAPIVSVVSPPYGFEPGDAKSFEKTAAKVRAGTYKGKRPDVWVNPTNIGAQAMGTSYGTTEGQIGVLPDVPITITSPPYAEAQEGGGIVKKGYKDTGDMVADRTGYRAKGLTPENIALLPDSGGALGEEAGSSPATRGGRGRRMASNQVHPQNPLPDTVTLTSPPYEDQLEAKEGREWLAEHSLELGRRGRAARTTLAKTYGTSEGQIGWQRQESYLDAMRLVYTEIAKVSPVLVVVVKDPTRNGKLRLLGEDTVRLMEAAGYRIFCRHRSILFEEQEQGHLFDGSVKQPKGRLGFFKRLAYRKGSPVANFEHVIFGLKKGTTV